MLKVLDLFSGIGGFSLGLERTGGFKTVAFCEIEPFCQRVLAKHWPEVPCYNDVRTLTAERLRADGIAVDVICGGFPCQDLSLAGRRAGIEGKRSGLWVEVIRLVRELRPQLVIMENVPGLLDHGLGRVLGALAESGYDATWDCIPAAYVSADAHCRDRVWLVSYPHGADHLMVEWPEGVAAQGSGPWLEWPDQPAILRAADGLPDRVDRLHALGNAVVPQIPELIGRAVLSRAA